MNQAPPSITQFGVKVKSASNRGSKDITLSMAEAVDLVASMNQVLMQQNQLLKDLVALQKQLLDGPQVVNFDGGGFDD